MRSPFPHILKLMWRWFVVCSIGVAIGVAYLYFTQNKMIFLYPRYPEGEIARVAASLKRIDYSTSAGKQIAFYQPPQHISSRDRELVRTHGSVGEVHAESPILEPLRIWMILTGNGGLALYWSDFRPLFRPTDGVFYVDYPGFGENDGRATAESIRESLEVALQQLEAMLGLSSKELNSRLAVLGESIGTGPALEIAVARRIPRVVLLYPYTSLFDMACLRFGRPLCYLLNVHFDNRTQLTQLLATVPQARVTIMHGDSDEIIPVEMSRELARIGGERIEYIEAAGGYHNFSSLYSIAEKSIGRALRD